jgi:hypothetical protein
MVEYAQRQEFAVVQLDFRVYIAKEVKYLLLFNEVFIKN